MHEWNWRVNSVRVEMDSARDQTLESATDSPLVVGTSGPGLKKERLGSRMEVGTGVGA